MKLCAFIGIGFMVTITIILVNCISMLLAKADEQNEWFWVPLLQNTLIAIIGMTLLVAHSIDLL